ncbi:MAG: hypothetical protein NZ653_08755, partial [Anaerolineae bacterium]|nr:hypothetical protein [Anaerolineae bacterium]
VFPALVGIGFATVRVPLVGGMREMVDRSLFKVSGGTSPRPPAMGQAPWTPQIFPALVGLGFATVLGPTRGRDAGGS